MRLQGEFRNTFLHLRGVEHSLVEGLVLVSDDGGDHGIAGDVDGGPHHVEDPVDAHDEGDGFDGDADGREDHGQGDETDGRDAGGTDGRQRCGGDDGQVSGDAEVDAVGLGREDDRDTLHDGGTIHVDGGTERDGERGNSPVDTDLLFEGLDVERDGRVRSRGRERERDDREELPEETQRVQT